MKSRAVLHNGGFDFVETVGAIAISNHTENTLPASLVGGKEVAHAARRINS
jgi:hypothetical protein